jgi:regulator of sigma E protease
MDIFIMIIFGLLGLNIIILFHELGHFIAAKLCGVGVETFSLGWGKKLVGFKFKGTTYQIAMFPIGGYCKFKNELFKADINEEEFQNAKKEKDSFLGAATWKKALITLSGPFAGLLFAVIVFSFIWLAGFDIRTYDNTIMLSVDAKASEPIQQSPAQAAGLQNEDTIVAINGKSVKTFYDITEMIKKTKKDEMLVLSIKRGNETIEKKVTPRWDDFQMKNIIGITNWSRPEIQMVEKSKPAGIAGLKEGDVIVSANDADIKNTNDFFKVLSEQKQTIDLTVLRGDAKIQATLKFSRGKEKEGDTGIMFRMTNIRSPNVGIIGSFARGSGDAIDSIVNIYRAIRLMVKIKISGLSDIFAGPVRIINIVGESATTGFNFGIGEGIIIFFRFLCNLSVLVSIMNLLPIPAFDGGQTVLAVIMGIKKDMSLKFMSRYQLVGFVIIFILIVLAVSSDVLYYL